MFKVEEPARVGVLVAPVQDIDKQFTVADIVTICPPPLNEFASKNTLSLEVGTDAPLAPPDEVDQLDVELISQVPVPQIQYLLAE